MLREHRLACCPCRLGCSPSHSRPGEGLGLFQCRGPSPAGSDAAPSEGEAAPLLGGPSLRAPPPSRRVTTPGRACGPGASASTRPWSPAPSFWPRRRVSERVGRRPSGEDAPRPALPGLGRHRGRLAGKWSKPIFSQTPQTQEVCRMAQPLLTWASCCPPLRAVCTGHPTWAQGAVCGASAPVDGPGAACLSVSHSGPERWPCLSGGRDACLSLRPGLSPHAEPECPATRLLTEAWAGTGGGVWLRETPPWQLPSGHAPQRSAGQLRAGGRGPPDSCAPGTAAVA